MNALLPPWQAVGGFGSGLSQLYKRSVRKKTAVKLVNKSKVPPPTPCARQTP